MSEYDQYVHGPGTATAAKPAAANEYDQYVKPQANAATAPLGGAPGFGSGGFGAVQKTVDRAGKNATKTVGRAIVQGHKDPVGSFLGAMQAPQRALEAVETGANPVKAFTDRRQGKSLGNAVKDKIGLGALERGPLAGNDIGHKVLRGVADIALDTVNDPVSYIPGLDATKIPGVRQGLTKLSESAIGKGASKLLNPDYKLRGLTPDAKAEYDVVSNRAKEAARTKREADESIIRKHADAIRSGQMPDEVARLFDPKAPTVLPEQARPGAPSSALNRVAAPVEAPISQLESKFTDKINQRPSAVARGAQVTPKVESPGGSIRPGSTTSRDVSRGAPVTPREVPRVELPPTISPGAPREALNARPAPRAAAPAGTLKSKFTDTMSRSNAGQSTSDAWKSHFLDDAGKLEFGPGTRPQDVARKLSASRAPALQDEIEKGLRDKGFFETPESIRAGQSMGKPGMFSAPVDEIPSVQKRLLDNLAPKPENKNAIIQGAKALTHRGNQAFLANPVPHVGNLTNLAYNKYGAPTAFKGLFNGARVAMGKTGGRLGENINELESLGAKSQYGNIFDEMGLTRIAGIPGTEGAARVANKALVPLQRASNAAQHKILNSAETGLRTAALDAERAGGTTGARAAKNIHATFGTDAPNALTQGAQDLAAPFFKFHGQTAPGSVLNTLARNPGRITNTVKANQDYNAQVNPHGPKYHSTVPGANAARMLMDPMGYFGSLGPISQLQSPFGLFAELKKGPKGVAKVISDNAGRFVGGSQEIAALAELLKHKKNPQSKASGIQDLSSTLFGGYYGK